MPSRQAHLPETESLLELLPRLGGQWVTPALLEAVVHQPDAPFHLLHERLAVKLVVRLCQPPFAEGFIFGRVAAAHALSGLYVDGARPVAALALLTLPELDIPGHQLRAIEAGIAACCQEAGVEWAGIHVMPGPELSCGLLALGHLNPGNVVHGTLPRQGDRIVLGKPLGYGAYQAAKARGLLHYHDLHEWQVQALLVNAPGAALDCLDGVHQLLEVGEGGLLACLRGLTQEGTTIRLEGAHLPALPRTQEFLGEGDYLGQLMRDEAINGSLVVVCAPEAVTEVLAIFLQQGFGQAVVVGEVVPAAAEAVVWA